MRSRPPARWWCDPGAESGPSARWTEGRDVATEGWATSAAPSTPLPSGDAPAPEGAPPSGTVTFLFTDIEGSTRLLERLRGRYAEVLADQRKLLRAAFARWHGHEIDTQGDAFFVAFGRAGDALRCAIDAQRGLAAHRWPGEADVRVRMGIHTGEPLVATTGYVGMDVHRAARIAAAGHGGQVLLSGTTRDLVGDGLPSGVELRDLGSHRLKDLRSEVHVFQVADEGLMVEFPPLTTTAAEDPPPSPGDPPYRGLQAFEEEDADLFFGREETVDGLVEQVREARFLALIGASGSGKSSLLRAGLIPALRAERPAWRIALLTPTAHPLEALAGAIAPDASPAEVAVLVDDLGRDPRSLALGLRPRPGRHAAERGRTLIAVDQLEEVFTLCRDEEERAAFLANLVHAAGLDEHPARTPPEADRATVIVTLRADFYAFLAPYSPVRAAAAASQAFVGAMSAAELRRAIEEPALRRDWEFVPGLVDLLLREVGEEPGALPLLSHALLETWRRRRGTTMTLRSYAESGGVKGAIARTADRIYEHELSEEQRPIARNIFVRLTELGEGTQDTRRRARLGELLPSDPAEATAVHAVITALADARLITVSEDSLEVAHEALIREWPTLREWLRADREGLRLHRRLTEAAGEWELAAFDDALVYRGARLLQLRDWAAAHPGVLNDLERRFLDASIALVEREEAEREAQRQRELAAAQALAAAETRRAEEAARSAAGLRRRAILLAGALVVVAVLAGLSVLLARQSDENAALADQRAAEARENADLADQRAKEADSLRLGSEGNAILARSENPELAALLALNGLRIAYTPQADTVLQSAARRYYGEQLFRYENPIQSVVLTPDGRVLIAASGGDVLSWDLDSGEQIGTLPAAATQMVEEEGWGQSIMLSDNGSVLLTASGAAYRLPDGSPIAGCTSSYRVTAEKAIAAALSPDGKHFAAATSPRSIFGASGVTVGLIDDCLDVQRRIDTLAGGTARSLAFSPDGTELAGVRDGRAVTVWDVETGTERVTFGADLGSFKDVAWDGGRIVTANWDGTARLFNARTGDLVQTFKGLHSVLEARLSPDGSQLLASSADGTARLWDVTTGRELRRYAGHAEAVSSAVFSPDGRYVFTASQDGTARRWSTDAPAEGDTYRGGDSPVRGVALSPDGRLLATGTAERIAVRDLTNGSSVVDVERPGTDRVVFSPDGHFLLAASADGPSLWDVRTAQQVPVTFAGLSGFYDARTASFSRDGEYVLVSTQLGIGRYPVHSSTERIVPIAYGSGAMSADGLRVTGYWWGDHAVTIVDAQTSDTIRRIEDLGGVADAAFTPDGSRLVTASLDNTARVWDVGSGELIRELRGHSGPVTGVTVTADGRYVVTVSDDGSARLWETETGNFVRAFFGHAGSPVAGAAVSADGRLLAIGSLDGFAVVTPMNLIDLEADVCSRLPRDLTDQERTRYGVEANATACPQPAAQTP